MRSTNATQWPTHRRKARAARRARTAAGCGRTMALDAEGVAR
ncbi:hypothetical protein [Tessaracoccus sp. Z1128]